MVDDMKTFFLILCAFGMICACGLIRPGPQAYPLAPFERPAPLSTAADRIYLAAGYTDKEEQSTIGDPGEEANAGDAEEQATIGDPGEETKIGDPGEEGSL